MAKSKLNIFRTHEYVLGCDRKPGTSMEDREFIDGFSLFVLKPLTHRAHAKLTALYDLRSGEAGRLAQIADMVTLYLVECIKDVRDYIVLTPIKDEKGEHKKDEAGQVLVEEKPLVWSENLPEIEREKLLSLIAHEHKVELFYKAFAINSFAEDAQKN